MLGIRQVYIGNNIHNPTVCLLRQTLVLAAVPRFHMENRDMQALCRNGRQAAVGISQDQQRVRPDLIHQFIRTVDDIPNGGAEIVPYRVHIDFRIVNFQVFKENPIQSIIIVLSGMGKHYIEIFTTLIDHCRQPDDLRTGTDDDEKLQLPVVFKMNIGIVCSDFAHRFLRSVLLS